MPFLLTPRVDSEPLLSRLSQLGSRRRFAAVFRGICLTLTIPLTVLALVGGIDHLIPLPSFIRALGLVSGLTATGLVVRRFVLEPLHESADPVTLALLIESRQPEWNDSLASTVQFLEDDTRGSTRLRQQAIRETLLLAEEAEFNAVIDTRGLRNAGILLTIAFAVVGPLCVFAPGLASTATARLLDPFGGHGWTLIHIDDPATFPARMARGQGFELAFTVSGRLPEQAIVILWPDDGTLSEQFLSLRESVESNAKTVPMRITFDPDQVARNFRVRIKAGDADSGWQSIAVLPPPVLVPIDGHPSPRLRVSFPAYTDQPALDLPDGSAFVECVSGSVVRLQAAVDRPIVEAMLQPRSGPSTAAIVAGFAADSPLASIGLQRLAVASWEPTPLAIDAEGQRIEGEFWPRLPGIYAFTFRDPTGLAGTRLLEVRLQADPAPAVALDRPSGDALYFVPDAELPVQIRVTDKIYAIRTVGLEYRTTTTAPTRTIPLFDAARLSDSVNQAFGIPSVRLRPAQWSDDNRLPLSRFRHADGSPLREGDVLILNAYATDFDDVSTFKAPGRSSEVLIRIVSPAALDATLQQAQVKARQDVEQLRDIQRRARDNVRAVQKALQANGKLQPRELEQLFQAEQLQQQLRAQLADPEQGLQRQIEQLRQTARENRLPNSPALRRLESMDNDLQRLTEEELVPIEPLIAQARKELDSRDRDPTISPRNESLRKAEAQQRNAEETLEAMLGRLQPWDAANELRGGARELLNETQRIGNEAKELGRQLPSGMKLDELQPEQRESLERLATRQDRLADDARQLADKLARLGADKQKTLDQQEAKLTELNQRIADTQRDHSAAAPNSDDAQRLGDELQLMQGERERLQEAIAGTKSEVQALRDAIDRSLAEGARRDLRQAADRLRQNQTGEAGMAQQQAAQQLQDLLQRLDEPRGEEPDRLRKKTKNAKGKINELIERQESLQKKVEQAQGIADPMARAAELKRLAQEQQRLEKLTRDAAKELADTNAEQSAQSLRRAERLMEEAREQLEQGQRAEMTQDDVLDQLDEGQRQLKQEERRQEEELGREEVRRVSDEVKALLERQRAALTESQRIHQDVLKAKKWSRALLTSLDDLEGRQTALAEELRGLIEKRFEDDRVFARLLRHATEAMDSASERMQERKQDGLDALQAGKIDAELESLAEQKVTTAQKLAIRRIEMLIEALQPDPTKPDQPAPMPPMPPMGDQPPPPEGNGPPNPNVIPPTAQLKALRALQAELNERTTAFAKAHPRIDELNELEEAELDDLRKAQEEVAELLKELLPLLEGQGRTP